MSEPWLDPTLVGGASPIAGTGRFTSRRLAAGTVVWTAAEDDPDPARTAQRLLNHSCDPTAGWRDERTLVSVAALEPGTEVTHDYAAGTSDETFLLRCHCGSPRCRQMVEGTDWRIPQLQRRYAGQWHPTVASLVDAQSGQERHQGGQSDHDDHPA